MYRREAHLDQVAVVCCCFGRLVKNSPATNQIFWVTPTQTHREPKVVGPIDHFAYRSPSAKQPSIAKALKGKMGIAREIG